MQNQNLKLKMFLSSESDASSKVVSVLIEALGLTVTSRLKNGKRRKGNGLAKSQERIDYESENTNKDRDWNGSSYDASGSVGITQYAICRFEV